MSTRGLNAANEPIRPVAFMTLSMRASNPSAVHSHESTSGPVALLRALDAESPPPALNPTAGADSAPRPTSDSKRSLRDRGNATRCPCAPRLRLDVGAVRPSPDARAFDRSRSHSAPAENTGLTLLRTDQSGPPSFAFHAASAVLLRRPFAPIDASRLTLGQPFAWCDNTLSVLASLPALTRPTSARRHTRVEHRGSPASPALALRSLQTRYPAEWERS